MKKILTKWQEDLDECRGLVGTLWRLESGNVLVHVIDIDRKQDFPRTNLVVQWFPHGAPKLNPDGTSNDLAEPNQIHRISLDTLKAQYELISEMP